MYITITLKISKSNKEYDLKVDKKQTILEFIRIANDSLNLNININNINFVKSETQKKLLSVHSTFEEESVFTGNIIEIY